MTICWIKHYIQYFLISGSGPELENNSIPLFFVMSQILGCAAQPLVTHHQHNPAPTPSCTAPGRSPHFGGMHHLWHRGPYSSSSLHCWHQGEDWREKGMASMSLCPFNCQLYQYLVGCSNLHQGPIWHAHNSESKECWPAFCASQPPLRICTNTANRPFLFMF